MANPIYDIAAISTNVSGDPAQIYIITTVTNSSGAGDAGSQQVFNAFHTALTSAGWTQSTSTTSNSRTIAEYYGLQSPWYDVDNVPSWYTQNIPWVRINAAASTQNLSYTPGLWNGTAGTHTATTAMTDTFIGVATFVIHVMANPYQVIMSARHPNNTRRSFTLSAIHVPDFVQERVQVKNAIFAVSYFHEQFVAPNAGVAWTLYESNLGTGAITWTGNPNLAIDCVIQGGGGVRSAASTHKYIWNPTDTAMGTSTTWYPLISPPTVAWADTRGISPNTPKARGMLWESLWVNRSYTLHSTVTGLPEAPTDERRDWLVVGTTTSEQPMSLLTIIGTST